MANPQVEKGYTPIANEILEQVYKLRLSGTQFKIILLVWRYTYGYHRTEHALSVSYIAQAIGVSTRMVTKEIGKLVRSRILEEARGPRGLHARVLRFNKDYDTWQMTGAERPSDANKSSGEPQCRNAQKDGSAGGGKTVPPTKENRLNNNIKKESQIQDASLPEGISSKKEYQERMAMLRK